MSDEDFYAELKQLFGTMFSNAFRDAQQNGSNVWAPRDLRDPHGIIEKLRSVRDIKQFREIIRGPGRKGTNIYGNEYDWPVFYELAHLPNVGAKTQAKIEAWAFPEAIEKRNERRRLAAEKRVEKERKRIDSARRRVSQLRATIADARAALEQAETDLAELVLGDA